MDQPKKQNPKRVVSAKAAHKRFIQNPQNRELLRKARSKGGKNGSKSDKSKAGTLGYIRMLETMAEQAKDDLCKITVSGQHEPNCSEPVKEDQG